MSEQKPSDVMGALPHSRPHRRSDKRTARSDKRTARSDKRTATTAGRGEPVSRPAAKAEKPAAKAENASTRPRLKQPAQPRGTPSRTSRTARSGTKSTSASRSRPAAKPAPEAERRDVLGSAVQAAAELTEIGLTFGARMIRGAVSKLPRP